MNSEKHLYDRPHDLQEILFKVMGKYLKDKTVSHFPHSKTSIFSGNISYPFKKYLESKKICLKLGIFQYMHCSGSCFILAIILMERIANNHMCPEFKINRKTIYKFFFTAVVVSLKINDDPFYAQTYYSKIAGIDANKLTLMETAFLRMLDHHISVSP